MGTPTGPASTTGPPGSAVPTRGAYERDTPDGIEHVFDLCHPGAVAGGMDRRPFRSASLAERTRRSTGAAAAPGPTPSSPATGPTETAGATSTTARRHCWVTDGTTPERRAAGLLVEWRQLGGAWQGRVAYVVDLDGEATLVEAWLPATQLERAAGG